MIVRANAYPADPRPNMRGGDGTVTLTPLGKDELPAKCRLFSTIELPVGASIGYHVHEGETEMFCFLRGKGAVRDDDETVEVGPGDAMFTPGGHGHSVANIGDEPLVIVACIVLD